ncbi:hypothetical protein [Longispora albida]|uniref:hypothetical protein n=1 Tax=Longispora albida TaxID=203523 RepID=UPI0003727B8F|nr:hypothetical protein [Longispora albida]
MSEQPAPATLAVDDLTATLTAFRQLDAEARRWAAARDELRRVIEARLGEAEAGTVAGRVAVRFSTYTDRRVDASRLRKLAPAALVAECTVETVRRRFSLVDEAAA